MSSPAHKEATYEDLLAVPSHKIAEIIHGVLHTQPRPAAIHARAASTLSEELGPPFNRGRGGPGGWIILYEPELHLGPHVLVPDLAGWTRERMPELPDVPHFTTPPDWVCEVLSPSTRALDRGEKLPIYAAQGVSHAWLVDPEARSLEVFRIDGKSYRLVGVHRDDQHIQAEPFDAITLELGLLWAR